MIGLDLDGTLLNYDHTTELRVNTELIEQLAKLTKEVFIITNQGGLVWHEANPTKYPSPTRFVERAEHAISALNDAGIGVRRVYVSLYHPKAEHKKIIDLYYAMVSITSPEFVFWHGELYRKPQIGMFVASQIDRYYGDSNEDEAAAKAFGCDFVRVPRFE